MEKPQKFQILKLTLIAALLSITPLLSTSLRPAYMYFIINLLIIAVGAEAGLLSFFCKPVEEKKNPIVVVPKPETTPEIPPNEGSPPINTTTSGANVSECCERRPKVVESSPEKIVGAAKFHKVKKSASLPTIFFIGGGENEAAEDVSEKDDEEEEWEEELGVPSAQELFTKAEAFIGNFYKQLKMQREESWKRLHDLYQKAF